jgi:hypothetical protein
VVWRLRVGVIIEFIEFIEFIERIIRRFNSRRRGPLRQ